MLQTHLRIASHFFWNQDWSGWEWFGPVGGIRYEVMFNMGVSYKIEIPWGG